MTKGKDRTPEEIMQVLSTFAITDNLSETSRRTGIPITTIKDIVDRHRGQEEFEKLRKEKREEFSQRANRIVFKGLTLLERRYDKALDNEDALSDEDAAAYAAAVKKIDKAAAKGAIHKNAAARKKSQFTVKLNAMN